MNAAAGLDLASLPERIQSEVQRAIQRSIKGVEYISSSGPSLGSTPKDILAVRGTMNLYHYRPIAEEIYRVPILIVMATTNRGYILDMVPGQSFIEFLLKRGAATNLPGDERWATPLAWARKRGLADIEEMLLKHGAD
jgi:polyhydroxyalkanoate synthase